MPLPLPLAGVRDQETRFALEQLAAAASAKSDMFLNARDYGMVGDNSTDNLAALNAAIAALNVNGGALYIPPGSYRLSDVPNAITADDIHIFGAGPATRLVFATSAAHGTFFTLGATGGDTASRVLIEKMQLQCNASSNTPPANEQAFVLVRAGTCYIRDILVHDIAGLCKIGTTTSGDRPQLYGFSNIFGTWNEVTSNPSRIHIINGTNGRYENIRLTANQVNGGQGIHVVPGSQGVDQHFFNQCEVWSMGAYSENTAALDDYPGIDRSVFLNFTDGQIVNWVFNQCVFDETRLHGVYIFSSANTNTCRDIHFVDCHWATNAGRGVHVNHGGTGRCQGIQVIGGRIRYKNAAAIQLDGANIDSFLAQGVSMQHESFQFFSTSAAGNTVSTDPGDSTKFKHGLAVDDRLKVVTSTVTTNPANLFDAGDTLYVTAVPTDYTFRVSDTLGGADIDITNNGSGSLIPYVEGAFQQDDANGVRVNGCYIGPFGTVTNTNYACINLAGSTSDYYAITGNVARAIVNATPPVFDNGYAATDGQVVANNAVSA